MPAIRNRLLCRNSGVVGVVVVVVVGRTLSHATRAKPWVTHEKPFEFQRRRGLLAAGCSVGDIVGGRSTSLSRTFSRGEPAPSSRHTQSTESATHKKVCNPKLSGGQLDAVGSVRDVARGTAQHTMWDH